MGRIAGGSSYAGDVKARNRGLCRSDTFEHCHPPDPPPQIHFALRGAFPIAHCGQVMASVILSAEGIQATVQFECSLSSLCNAYNA
jgi:hypothetical protein